MKNLLLYVAILFASNTLFAQSEKDRVIYLDSVGLKTTEGNHSTYVVIKDYYDFKKPLHDVVEYYKSKKIKQSHQTTQASYNFRSTTGNITWYFENGNKKEEYKPLYPNENTNNRTLWNENGTIQEEKFTDLKTKTTISHVYYENGKKKHIAKNKANTASTNEFPLIIDAWNINNVQTVKNGNGNYTIEDSSIKIQGIIKDSLRQGEWIEEDKKTGEKFIERFENGKLTNGISIDSKGQKTNYTELKITPTPEKGLQHFLEFIHSNFKLTPEAEKSETEGKLIFEMTVANDGRITKIRTLQALGYGLEEEGKKVISSYGNWIPGKIRGKNSSFKLSIPINLGYKSE